MQYLYDVEITEK